jgi:hypothetical protein
MSDEAVGLEWMHTGAGSVVVVVAGGDFDFDVEAALDDEDVKVSVALSKRPAESSATPDFRMTFSRFRVHSILRTTALALRAPRRAFATLNAEERCVVSERVNRWAMP